VFDTCIGDLIEAEKSWTHTDYNWLVCDTPDATEQKGKCVLPDGTILDEIPRKGDITDPDDDVLALPLLQDGDDKYLVNAIVKSQNDRFQNTSPGAFYALTTINVLADVDGLTVWEDYSDCVDGDLENGEVDIKLLGPAGKQERAVKVAIADPDGIATEISKDLYDADAITFTGDQAHVVIEQDIPAGSTVFVVVKFQHDMKNFDTDNGDFDGMCDNTEKVDAFLLDQDDSVTAEASLRITTG
jgi:hypothetical protein